MSTTAPHRGAQPSDVSAVARISLARLVRVELLKMAISRPVKWLFFAVTAITALFIAVSVVTAAPVDRGARHYIAVAAGPQNLLLPVLGILLISVEWTQRTAAVTHTLMPVRRRVLLSQTYAVLIIGISAIAISLGLAALAALPSGNKAWSELRVGDLATFGIVELIGLLQGAAFGLLFLNFSTAILSYLAVPAAINLVSSMWLPLTGAQPWFDLWTAQQSLLSARPTFGEQWLPLATSTALWVILPFVLGAIRLHRADIT